MVPEINKLEYQDRLKVLNLPTLSYRRLRGDMLEMYKLTHNFYDSEVSDDLIQLRGDSGHNLRGHKFKIEKKIIINAKHKHFFCNRVVNVWNKLPPMVVDAPSLNSFKNRLDKLWKNQDLVTNYRAEIDPRRYSTGNCEPESEEVIEDRPIDL